MKKDVIWVAVVDDNDMLRYGLTVALRSFSELEIVGEGRSGDEAIDLCRTTNPHVLLIDLIMPGMDGVTAIRHIREEMPEIKCVALTSFDEASLIQSALQAGAISYLVKNMSLTTLLEAIQDTHAGKSTFSREAVQALRDQSAYQGRGAVNLTEYEISMLRLMAQGLKDHEIATRLSVDTAVVLRDMASMLVKLGAANRAEALIIARRDNFITAES